MTALCLLPLMAFAAFGVDLASFYSRASYLQKSADAAALAGTVWMPNLTKSRESRLRQPPQQRHRRRRLRHRDPSGWRSTQGATANSLRVTITDPNATRYFSQVFGSGDQPSPDPPKPNTTSPSPSAAPSTTSAATPTAPQPTRPCVRTTWRGLA